MDSSNFLLNHNYFELLLSQILLKSLHFKIRVPFIQTFNMIEFYILVHQNFILVSVLFHLLASSPQFFNFSLKTFEFLFINHLINMPLFAYYLLVQAIQLFMEAFLLLAESHDRLRYFLRAIFFEIIDFSIKAVNLFLKLLVIVSTLMNRLLNLLAASLYIFQFVLLLLQGEFHAMMFQFELLNGIIFLIFLGSSLLAGVNELLKVLFGVFEMTSEVGYLQLLIFLVEIAQLLKTRILFEKVDVELLQLLSQIFPPTLQLVYNWVVHFLFITNTKHDIVLQIMVIFIRVSINSRASSWAPRCARISPCLNRDPPRN